MKYKELCPSCGHVKEIKEDDNLYTLREFVSFCSSCGKAALILPIVNADMVLDPKRPQFEHFNSYYSNFRAIKNREYTSLLKHHIQTYSFLYYFNLDDFLIGIEKCFDDFRETNNFYIPIHLFFIALNRIFPSEAIESGLSNTFFNFSPATNCIKAGEAFYKSDDPSRLLMDFRGIAEDSIYYMLVLSTMIKEGIIDCKLTRAEIGLAHICDDMLIYTTRHDSSSTRRIITDKICYIYDIAASKINLSNSDDILI